MRPIHRRLSILLASVIAVGMLAGAASADVIYRAFNLPLSSAQEVPTNSSTATGTMNIAVNTTAKTISFHIAYSGLTSAETAAHFHGPALPGFNAAVKIPLPAGQPKDGTLAYAPADEADILSGKWYANIHTSINGGGEIRGQIVGLSVNALPATTPIGLTLLALAFAGAGVFFVVRRRRESLA